MNFFTMCLYYFYSLIRKKEVIWLIAMQDSEDVVYIMIRL